VLLLVPMLIRMLNGARASQGRSVIVGSDDMGEGVGVGGVIHGQVDVITVGSCADVVQGCDRGRQRLLPE
jgi:hypothetical protein